MCHLTLNSDFCLSFSVVSSDITLFSVELCHLTLIMSFNVNYVI